MLIGFILLFFSFSLLNFNAFTKPVFTVNLQEIERVTHFLKTSFKINYCDYKITAIRIELLSGLIENGLNIDNKAAFKELLAFESLKKEIMDENKMLFSEFEQLVQSRSFGSILQEVLLNIEEDMLAGLEAIIHEELVILQNQIQQESNVSESFVSQALKYGPCNSEKICNQLLVTATCEFRNSIEHMISIYSINLKRQAFVLSILNKYIKFLNQLAI